MTPRKAWRAKAADGLIETRTLDDHYVRVYWNRLAIWRKNGKRMGWEELQKVKQQIWGDKIAIEIYPAQTDVVNLAYTRHLWHTPLLQTVVKKVCLHKEFEKS